ncbi:MAG TPA: LD-carboxypeptidase [Acholeplasmataceae bacterium]|nr:LD-carboxypeptidase [Acholeplasmataceae bacterium]
MKVKRLLKGDTIYFLCPSFKCQMESQRIKNLENIIHNLGYKIKYGKTCFLSNGYLAGTDGERIKDLEDAFLDNEVKAIICLKGGYGASRIVDKLNYQIIKKNPKIFMGFSDITVLLNAFYQKANLPTIHGEMGIFLGRNDIDQDSIDDFKDLLEMPMKNRVLTHPSIKALSEGVTQGVLVGGNLSLITNLIGTPYDIDFNNKIVFIEEVDEAPYRIDRMFAQLRLSGKLEQAKGFIFGHFTNCVSESQEHQQVTELISEYFIKLNKPIIINFPSGHEFPFLNLPIGLQVELDANAKIIKIIEEYYEKD